MAGICVVGAGVSGLTTAIELTRRGHRVSVIAASTGKGTTSSAAAAFWYPFWTGIEPDHGWYRPVWAWDTFLTLDEIVASPKAGVTRANLVEYYDAEMDLGAVERVIDSMWWRVLRRIGYQTLNNIQVSNVACAGKRFQSGSGIETLVVNMASYLPWLEETLLQQGVSVTKKDLSPDDLAALCQKFDYVVNCAGLGARALVADSLLRPAEGVVVRVKAISAIQNVTLVHTGPDFGNRPLYIVPRGGDSPDIILGGTIREVEGDPRHLEWPVPRQELRIRADSKIILEDCTAIEPALRKAEIIGVTVGYRPTRPMARVEPEFSGPLAGRVIHNYGHGGGGVTLSWGCAREIGRWVDWLSDSSSLGNLLSTTRMC